MIYYKTSDRCADPKEFACFDDSPLNNGWGYNSRWGDDDEELEDDGELETVTDDE